MGSAIRTGWCRRVAVNHLLWGKRFDSVHFPPLKRQPSKTILDNIVLLKRTDRRKRIDLPLRSSVGLLPIQIRFETGLFRDSNDLSGILNMSLESHRDLFWSMIEWSSVCQLIVNELSAYCLTERFKVLWCNGSILLCLSKSRGSIPLRIAKIMESAEVGSSTGLENQSNRKVNSSMLSLSAMVLCSGIGYGSACKALECRFESDQDLHLPD